MFPTEVRRPTAASAVGHSLGIGFMQWGTIIKDQIAGLADRR